MKEINLKNLSTSTAQEVFEYCVTNLLKQNKKSLDYIYGNKCKYRGAGGTKCVAGFLISDEEYDEWIDNNYSWKGLIKIGFIKDTEHSELIYKMQLVHDNYDVKNWVDAFENLGIDNNLNINFIKQLK